MQRQWVPLEGWQNSKQPASYRLVGRNCMENESLHILLDVKGHIGHNYPKGEDRQGLFLQVINTYCEVIGPPGSGRSLAKDRELRRLHRYDKHLTKVKPAKTDMSQEGAVQEQPLTNDLLAVGSCWRRNKTLFL